jgi:hypothetical protein
VRHMEVLSETNLLGLSVSAVLVVVSTSRVFTNVIRGKLRRCDQDESNTV